MSLEIKNLMKFFWTEEIKYTGPTKVKLDLKKLRKKSEDNKASKEELYYVGFHYKEFLKENMSPFAKNGQVRADDESTCKKICNRWPEGVPLYAIRIGTEPQIEIPMLSDKKACEKIIREHDNASANLYAYILVTPFVSMYYISTISDFFWNTLVNDFIVPHGISTSLAENLGLKWRILDGFLEIEITNNESDVELFTSNNVPIQISPNENQMITYPIKNIQKIKLTNGNTVYTYIISDSVIRFGSQGGRDIVVTFNDPEKDLGIKFKTTSDGEIKIEGLIPGGEEVPREWEHANLMIEQTVKAVNGKPAIQISDNEFQKMLTKRPVTLTMSG